jgi:anti-anti-sigma factor
MKIQLRRLGSVTVLDLSGKVTMGQADEALLAKVAELLEGEGLRHLLINLEQVPYMDSTGIGTLVLCYKHARQKNAELKLLNPAKRVFDLLHIVKLDSIFECFTDEQQAVASFSIS